MTETKPVSTTGPIDTAFLNDMIEHHAREHNKLRALHSDSIEHIAIWTALTELRELRKVVGAVEKIASRHDLSIMQTSTDPEEWEIGMDLDETCCPSKTFTGDSLISALSALVAESQSK